MFFRFRVTHSFSNLLLNMACIETTEVLASSSVAVRRRVELRTAAAVATCVAVVRRDRFDSKTHKNVELEIRCDSGNDDRGSCRGRAHPFATSYTGS